MLFRSWIKLLLLFFSMSLFASTAKISLGPWGDHMKMGQLPVEVLEQGGAGDCFFFSVAAAMKTLDSRVSPQGLRKRVARFITERNWESYLLSMQDAFILQTRDIKAEDVYWLDVFKEQQNFPGKPWKLLQALVSQMASKGPIEIEVADGLHNLRVNYWGNSKALEILSKDLFFRKIRLIVLNSSKLSIGEVSEDPRVEGGTGELSSAKIFSEKEKNLYEARKELNILLWWTGGHFQILGKQLDEDFVGSGIGIKVQEKKYFRVVWPNCLLPRKVKELYSRQCHYSIPD